MRISVTWSWGRQAVVPVSALGKEGIRTMDYIRISCWGRYTDNHIVGMVNG